MPRPERAKRVSPEEALDEALALIRRIRSGELRPYDLVRREGAHGHWWLEEEETGTKVEEAAG